MTQIRNSHGQIVANVEGYRGGHRSGAASQASPFMPFAGRHSGLPGRHGARCECLPGYVCLTHRIAR
jgi:hypothetical protein